MNDSVTTATASSKKAPPVVETVEMTDGRQVDFVGKRKLLKETLIESDEEGNPVGVAVRFDFRNGQTRTFSPPESLVLRFVGHGIEQKVGDETAGLDDVDDMVEDVDDLLERLSKGEWSIKREGGFAGSSILMTALMEFSKKSKDQIKEFLKNKTQADKLALRTQHPGIKAIVERLEAEKAAKATKVDTADLLNQLSALS